MPHGICSRCRFQIPKPLRMPMAATPTNKPTGDDRNLVPVDEKYTALTFEDKLTQFWARNRMLVLGLCGLVLLAILGKGGWDILQRQKENEVEKAYEASTTTEQLKSFAASHADHPLA